MVTSGPERVRLQFAGSATVIRSSTMTGTGDAETVTSVCVALVFSVMKTSLQEPNANRAPGLALCKRGSERGQEQRGVNAAGETWRRWNGNEAHDHHKRDRRS